jgi:hypothetical protein
VKPAPIPQPQPATPPRALTRNDLIALGQAGRPWDYAPVAVRALGQVPQDTGLRFLLAANLAQLGLGTLAGETLGELPDSASTDPDVRALVRVVEGLPDDRVSVASRRSIALGNLRALRARGADADGALSAAFAAWSEGLETSECFSATDGNLVRREGRDGTPAWTHFLIDQRTLATTYCAQHIDGSELFSRALAIEGIDPPWLFDQAWRALSRSLTGYAPPITILQADAMEFFDGLSGLDLREQLIDPRVRVFVGADASQRWLNDALERVDESVLGTAVALPGVRARISPLAQAVTGRGAAAQAEEFARLQTKVSAMYAGRDAAWWARRYRDARQGGPRLRVLVPTSRYSTYVRHAAEDLVAAFEELDCEARVAMESGPNSKQSASGHLRPIAEFEPDLIALVNYFRGDLGLAFPEQVPWLCWLQDSMSHQFAERRWGELDFVAGHLHKEIAHREGFPNDRSMPFPVVASARKFHAEPVGTELAERFACEVAYVSHQSETAEAFHNRFVAEAREPALVRVLDAVRPLVEEAAAEPMGSTLLGRLQHLTREVAHRIDPAANVAGVGFVYRHYALPLADRVIRHQMLRWAGEVCERRGWRLRLYGRGWESHPEFARYARGELAHGEELRACYQSAAVHLHASACTLVHQRVMECALSGGLPIARLTYDALSESLGFGKREALLHHKPCGHNSKTGHLGFRRSECPELESICSMHEQVGQTMPDVIWLRPAQIEAFGRPNHPTASGIHPAWLYGDLIQGTIQSAGDLERVVGRAVEDRAWRESMSSAMAARVRERCTVEIFAKKVLGMVTGSLETSSAEGSASAAA